MARMSIPSVKEPPLYRINQFKGINLSVHNSQIDENQSPDMLNVTLDERGALNKRTGYKRLFPDVLGDGVYNGPINGMYRFRKPNGTDVLLYAHGPYLHAQVDLNAPTVVIGQVADNEVNFFTMNGKCYIQDGVNLYTYTGTFDEEQIQPVTNVYVPTLTISTPPSGGGEPYEDFNLIGTGFKQSFSGDGTKTKYVLALQNLASNTVTAEVNGSMITEGSGLTVDRIKGEVTFASAPSNGTNNVIIKAHKTVDGFKDRIFKCRLSVLFGGSNDTRVFISGNSDEPNTIWRSGLSDPTYWPENGFYKIGADNEKVQGFAKQYDYLVIEKENSKWNMSYSLTEAGIASFPVKPINDQVGTIAKKSIQVIENNPVSLSDKGVYMLVSSNVRDERNVQHLSANVDEKLLREPNLYKAVSVDYDKKYWLAVNGNVYVYDYQLSEWYIYNNINAAMFEVFDGELLFGSSEQGMIYQFRKKTELEPYNDDGQSIPAYWYSKLINFGAPERYKLIKRIFYTLNPDTHTSAKVYLRTDQKGERLISDSRLDAFSFLTLDFSKFSFITSDVPQEIAKKVKEKKITHVQLKFENNELNENVGILSVGIKYAFQNEVK